MTRNVSAHLAQTAVIFLLAATVRAKFGRPGVSVSSEADALLAWKASLVEAAALSRWTRATPVCSWDGVSCDADRVAGLNLVRLGLSGGLGTLDMAALPALTALALGGNNLVGNIPASISLLHSLEMLDLSNNELNGSIPPQLGDMRSLVILQLSNNSLLGDVAHQLLCRLHAVVQVLDMSNNQFTGKLRPDCLCNLRSLRFMDLSSNHLTGELPACWLNMQVLEYVDLSNNSFSGEIPAATASNNCSLTSLYLARNGFTGAFPPFLESCYLLSALDIGNNRFFGGIPAWIGSAIPYVRILILRSNNFTGEIPPGLSQIFGLQMLDMANNSFTGSIPVALGNLRSMMTPPSRLLPGPFEPLRYKHRIDVLWKGQRLVLEGSIWSLTSVDLSSNLLSQCIPDELTNLRGLRFLNLSSNHLSCGIPKDIGRMDFLESLDLSSNELSGSIPPSISILSGLSTFNLSNNHLSGKIPVGSQIQTLTDPSIYSNNYGLCGFPLDIPCTDTSFTPDERNVQDEGNGEGEDQWLYYCVIAGIVVGFWIWFAMLFVIETWRRSFHFFIDEMQFKIMQKLSL